MRRRPTPKPPVVETRKRRAGAPPAAPPRPLPPDRGRIQAIRADDPPRPPPSKTRVEWMRSEVTVWVNRLKMANDPTVVRGAAEKLAHRDDAEGAMTSIMALPNHPLGPGYFIVAGKGRFNVLGLALKSLFSLVTFIKPGKEDIRSPSSLKPFIKGMRRGE